MRTAAGVTYVHTDHLGSTSVTSGAQSGNIRYFPYGATRSGAVATAYKFTGQRLDDSTGLYYYGARYYDAALGRFIQADSIVPNPGNPQALNRYSYVYNNPLRYVDPTGHWVAINPDDPEEISILTSGDTRFRDLNTTERALLKYLVTGDERYLASIPDFGGGLAWASGRTIINVLNFMETPGPNGEVFDDWGTLLALGAASVLTRNPDKTATALGNEFQAAKQTIQRIGGKGKFPPFKTLPTRPGYERHHLIEKRLAKVLDIAPGDIPADYVPPEMHRGPGSITAELRRLLPYRRYGPEDIQSSWSAYQEVYTKFGRQDWLEAIRLYFGWGAGK